MASIAAETSLQSAEEFRHVGSYWLICLPAVGQLHGNYDKVAYGVLHRVETVAGVFVILDGLVCHSVLYVVLEHADHSQAGSV